jgi:ribosomal protein L24
MDFFSKLLRAGDRVRIITGGLKGLTGIIRRFSSGGNPVLAVDGLFEVMVGLKNIRMTTATVDARRLN